MKITALLICILLTTTVAAQKKSNTVITTDIDNFWTAYDQIIATKDSVQKYQILNQNFIAKGTPGLEAMMAARSYNSKSYIDAINDYPLYWASIRKAMYRAKSYSDEIAKNVEKLRELYPSLKPAKIYFTVGAFRSGGTTMDSLVLIGSEIAMADQSINVTEFDKTSPALASYLKTSPVNTLVFTNIHEYVHTQQKSTIANNLLGQSIMEGVAELLAEKATGKKSTLPALTYGRLHRKHIAEVFSLQMFNHNSGFWLYSNAENEFKVRDLGYFVGYAICEAYYNNSPNKTQTIKEMIELDYNNQQALLSFVEQSGFFEKSVASLAAAYEDNRPRVLSISPEIVNQSLKSSVETITVTFSEAMDKNFRNFELGPLGQENLLVIKKMIGFSEDGKTLSFEVQMASNKQYQLVVAEGFRNKKGISLKPYLIDFRTMP